MDTVVGTALMLIVFTGFTAAFQLAVYAVGNNKSRAGAIALANERLEFIRSLSYNSIGTSGGIPAGAIAQMETVELNDIDYTRRTFVSYEDDPGDGLGGADSNGITVDYKAAKVSVSWETRQGTRSVTLVSRISPPGIESAIPGGTLSIQVTNDADQGVANAPVRIVNSTVSPAIDTTTYTNEAGLATVLGAPAGAGYEITATKAGYTTSQTYSANATNTNPTPAHLGVAESQTTAANFEIDLLSSLTVATFEPIEAETWSDDFASGAQLETMTGTELSGGSLRLSLEGDPPAFVTSGTAVSVAITPTLLAGWGEFSWTETEPAGTSVRYRVYDSGSNLVPDSALAGNSAGFTTNVDLSGIATSSYPTLRLGAELLSDGSETPTVDSWQVTYDVGPTPLPNIPFVVQGAKTIGAGPSGPVYKYNVQHSSGPGASLIIANVEYDTYSITVPASSGYDIASSCAAQPTVVSPNSSVATQLYLVPHTTHSLLVDVRAAGGAPVTNAQVRLYRGVYDTTLESDACGQAHFSGLSLGTDDPYAIDVSASGFTSYTSSVVTVNGTTKLSIILD